MAPPSVVWRCPNLKSGVKIRWQDLLVFLIPLLLNHILVMPSASLGSNNHTNLNNWFRATWFEFTDLLTGMYKVLVMGGLMLIKVRALAMRSCCICIAIMASVSINLWPSISPLRHLHLISRLLSPSWLNGCKCFSAPRFLL